MNKLLEGLRPGDLENLVLPLISVDEYNSKLDNKDAIVVGFYVHDKEPAGDLSKFIGRGVTKIFDTEVSPAPNTEGYYMVFVEFLRDETFFKEFMEMVKSLDALCNITEWQFKPYKSAIQELSEDNLRKIIKIKNTKTNEHITKEISLFLKNSNADDLIFEGETLKIQPLDKMYIYEYGPMDHVLSSKNLYNKPIRLDERAQEISRPISRVLGPQYQLSVIGENIIISKPFSNDILILS